MDESGSLLTANTPADGENVKMYYMVHPAVDTESSSMAASSSAY